jgi:hypothetical protein
LILELLTRHAVETATNSRINWVGRRVERRGRGSGCRDPG